MVKSPSNHSSMQKILNLWAIILIVWSVYRAYFKTSLPIWFDEFIAKPTIFIIPVYYYITQIEKRNFFEGINLKVHNIFQHILFGVLVGFAFFISGSLGLAFKTGDITNLFTQSISLTDALFFFIIGLMTSISEEVLTRGFVLKRLYEDSKNIFTSSFLVSILFFFMHVPILFTSDKIIGMVLLRVMFTDLILSLAVSFIFIERKNLIIPIFIHAFYSLSLYLFTK